MDLREVTPDLVDVDNPDEGDIYVDSDGDYDVLEGDEAEAFFISVGLNLFQGEWFLDMRQGMPWRSIIGEKYDQLTIRRAVVAGIMRRGTVSSVSSVSISIVDRHVNVDWEAVLIGGGEIDGGVNI